RAQAQPGFGPLDAREDARVLPYESGEHHDETGSRGEERRRCRIAGAVPAAGGSSASRRACRGRARSTRTRPAHGTNPPASCWTPPGEVEPPVVERQG